MILRKMIGEEGPADLPSASRSQHAGRPGVAAGGRREREAERHGARDAGDVPRHVERRERARNRERGSSMEDF